jgi:hypothetical protein
MRKTKIFTAGGTMQQIAAYDKGEVLASSIIVQMLAGAAGALGYLQLGVPKGTAADATKAFQIPAAASATVPGAPFVYQVSELESGERIDLSEAFIDGAHAGDKILVSWWEILK